MLEKIHSVPEDRRKVQLMLDGGLVAFGIATLADGALLQGSAGMAVAGGAAALFGLAVLSRLRARFRADPVVVRG